MSYCYKKPCLQKALVRLDFSAKYNLPEKSLPKKVSDEILKLFPIPEPKEILTKQVHITNEGIKEQQDKQNHLFFFGKEREKSLCISPDFFYIEINKYETYLKFRDEFMLIIAKLLENEDFSIKRFGLRYINHISIDETNPLLWHEYLNQDLLSMFNVPYDKNLISRAFSNVVQQFDDGMMLNFQYGMHNPDFPSRIRRKLFILDLDANFQGLIDIADIKNDIDKAHDRIEQLFEKSITDQLRALMEVENG